MLIGGVKLFSDKYGFAKKEYQDNYVSLKLRTRIWNCFYNLDIQKAIGNRMKASLKFDMTIEKIIGDRLGLSINDTFILNTLEKYIKNTCEWFEVYDFIEVYLTPNKLQELNVHYIVSYKNNLEEKVENLKKIYSNEISEVVNIDNKNVSGIYIYNFVN